MCKGYYLNLDEKLCPPVKMCSFCDQRLRRRPKKIIYFLLIFDWNPQTSVLFVRLPQNKVVLTAILSVYGTRTLVTPEENEKVFANLSCRYFVYIWGPLIFHVAMHRPPGILSPISDWPYTYINGWTLSHPQYIVNNHYPTFLAGSWLQ